jgi:hypothetical protein
MCEHHSSRDHDRRPACPIQPCPALTHLHDRIIRGLVDTRELAADQVRLEEDLRAAEALVTDGDHLTIRQLVVLLERSRLLRLVHLILEVECDIGELLLDVAHDFTLGGGGERITTLGEDLHEVVRQIATGEIETEDGVRECITLIDRHRVRHTITGVQHDTSGTTRRIERQDGLQSTYRGGVESQV